MTHGTYQPAGRRIRQAAAYSGVALAAALLAWAPPSSQARVTKIVVDNKGNFARVRRRAVPGRTSGRVYETLAGRSLGRTRPERPAQHR